MKVLKYSWNDRKSGSQQVRDLEEAHFSPTFIVQFHPMNDQAKIQRTIRLLVLLAGKKWYSSTEIEERIGIGKRTIFRYLQTLEQAGFVIERNARQGFRLAAESGSMLTMQRLLHFTEEEAYLLYKTLELLTGEGPAQERLLRKLHTLYDCQILAQAGKQHSLEIIAALQTAMAKKQQCILHQYRSNQSQTIENRIIEPFAFTENYEAIWGYEPATHTCKQFKLARMEKAEVGLHGWQYEQAHAIPFTDAFGFAAPNPVGHANLRLSLRAANLLREEYPMSEKHLSALNGIYLATLPFASYLGIGRFIRGLRDEIEVMGPVGLKKYVDGG